MKKPLFAAAFIFSLSITYNSFAQEPALPRVLILGDSISMAYTPLVAKTLEKEAVVIRPRENCQGTNYGVTKIDAWLETEGGKWDVIHFNFGLHDLKRINPKTGGNSNSADSPHQASPEKYAEQLAAIVEKLKATDAKLIFATTTPVPPGGVKPHRSVEDAPRYNALAAKIMEEQGIAVNDLYSLALPKLKDIQQPVNVHFKPEGTKLLAEQVSASIRAALKE